MNSYQLFLLIIAQNLVPTISGGFIVFLWLKYAKGWKKVEHKQYNDA